MRSISKLLFALFLIIGLTFGSSTESCIEGLTCKEVGCCTNSINELTKKRIVGYYSEWKYDSYPLSQVNFEKLTHINYAFSNINPITFDLEYDNAVFQDVVNTSHQHNVKVLMSVGGWYGSRYFTKMTSSDMNIDKFVANCNKMIENTGADGIDIDWEYPGSDGACNNPDYANDSKNLLKLLKKLRISIGSKLITAAVNVITFEENKKPLPDMSKYANFFDFINVMTYDFTGSRSNVTSHHGCFDNAVKGHKKSVITAVNNWKNANFPGDKIVVGIPAFGKSVIAASAMNNGLYQQIAVKKPRGDEDDSNETWTNYCGVTESSFSGSWKYRNIRKSILINDYKTATGDWVRSWDDVAKAPTLFNRLTKQFITYDDPESVKYKIDYVNENELGGIMIWELAEDTADHELLSYVEQNLVKYNKKSSNQVSSAFSGEFSDGCLSIKQKIKYMFYINLIVYLIIQVILNIFNY